MIGDITKGVYDSQLDTIIDAIKRRRKYLGEIKFFDFKNGDRVKLFNLTPKHLNGLVGKVVDKKTKRISVQIEDGVPTRILNVPPACLEKV